MHTTIGKRNRSNTLSPLRVHDFMNKVLSKKCISIFLMQAYVEQKLSGSSFVGAYSSGIPAYLDFSRLTVIDTQILRWRGFDAHVPACFPVKYIFRIKDNGFPTATPGMTTHGFQGLLFNPADII
jgi:hypothetical protein